jgi:hypothetical protein
LIIDLVRIQKVCVWPPVLELCRLLVSWMWLWISLFHHRAHRKHLIQFDHHSFILLIVCLVEILTVFESSLNIFCHLTYVYVLVYCSNSGLWALSICFASLFFWFLGYYDFGVIWEFFGLERVLEFNFWRPLFFGLN